MLLDRRKVKFWQKIVFGVHGLPHGRLPRRRVLRRLNGCTVVRQADRRHRPARAGHHQVPRPPSRPIPRTPQAWRNLADAYVSDVSPRHTQERRAPPRRRPSSSCAADGLPQGRRSCSPSRRAPAAKAQRLDALERAGRRVRLSCGTTRRRSGCTATSPRSSRKDAEYVLRHGRTSPSTPATPTTALLAFTQLPRARPERPADAPQVKAWIKQNAPSPPRLSVADQVRDPVNERHVQRHQRASRPTQLGVIALSGEVDIYTAPQFKECLLELLDSGVTRPRRRPQRGHVHRLHGARRAHRRRAPRARRRRLHDDRRHQPSRASACCPSPASTACSDPRHARRGPPALA